jgi:ketosteroid isomerase-like protein
MTSPSGTNSIPEADVCNDTEWTSHARARSGAPYDNDYAVVFHVADGLIDAVTEYCDTSYMKRVLFDQ